MWRRIAGLLIVGLVLTACLVPIHFESHREFWQRVMDALHFPLFAALTMLIRTTTDGIQRPLHFTIVSSGIAVLGVEIMQGWTGREPSLIDATLGISGVAWSASYLHWKRPLTLGLLATVLCATALLPAAQELRAIHWQRTHFPILAQFEAAVERRLWSASEGTTTTLIHDAKQGSSLEIICSVATFPGVRFNANGMDWGCYGGLVFAAWAEREMTLSLRLDDAEKRTRFYHATPLTQGWNTVRVPLQNVVRGKVSQVVFFLEQNTASIRFRLDGMHLE